MKRKYLSDTEDEDAEHEPEPDHNTEQEQRVDAVQAVRRRRIWLAQLIGFISSAPEMREAVIALLPISAGRSSSSEEDQHQDDDPGEREAVTLAHLAEMRRRTDTCASYEIAIAKERASFAWCEPYVCQSSGFQLKPIARAYLQVH